MLFSMPKREETNSDYILDKISNKQNVLPTIKLSGSTSLSDKLKMIADAVERNLGDKKDDYLLITSDEEFINYCKNAIGHLIALDTETTGLTINDQKNLVGICIQSDNQKPAYAPVGHISTITETLLPNQVSKQAIKEGLTLLKNEKLIFHNAYYDLVVLYFVTGILFDVYWDTMVCSFMLNENEPHGLKYQYDRYVMSGKAGVHKFAELFDDIPFCYILYTIGYIYGAHDAEMTLKLYKYQKPYMTKGTAECAKYKLEKVADLYLSDEIPLIKVLVSMKLEGLQVDYDKINELRLKYENLKHDALVEFNKSTEIVKDKIINYISNSGSSVMEYPVNYNSPAQMAILLYDILNVGIVDKSTPRGTGAKVISLITNNPNKYNKTIVDIMSALAEVKKYDKVINSFIDKIDEESRKTDGKIYSDLNQTSARTGRLSSSGVLNVQQIPSKMSDIRNIFIAGKDRVFIFADYSQQEVILCGCASNDTDLLNVFRSGGDTYSNIASLAFNVPYEDCLEFYPDGTVNKEGKKRRKQAKAIVLGLLYSKGLKAISEDLNVSIEMAQQIKDAVLGKFVGVSKFIDNTISFAKTYGYVETIYGRKRRLPDILLDEYEYDFPIGTDQKSIDFYTNLWNKRLGSNDSYNEKQKLISEIESKGVTVYQNGGLIAKAVRECVNACIQGAASSVTKKAMLLVHNSKILQELDCRLVLSIHD